MKRTDAWLRLGSVAGFALASLVGCSETSTTAADEAPAEGGVAAADGTTDGAGDGAGETTNEGMAMTDTASAAGEGVLAGLTIEMLDGTTADLAEFAGRPVLVVNTASKCGYTPQYDQLQAVHEKYAEQGLVVLGFPSGDFGGQEYDSAEEIGEFCRVRYGVTFPLAAKSSVKGDAANPLFARLISQPEPIGGDPKWNFTKFLVSPEGEVVARYGSSTKPDSAEVTEKIESLLGA
ncbi:MAG: glutathione peroxidase [Planctomycetota bacterium]